MRPDLRPWIAWFCALLITTSVAGIANWRPNDVPSQRFVAPGWQPDRLLDESYYRSLDEWISDRAATRGAGLWTRYQLDYKLLGDSTTPLLAIGDDGWVFHRIETDHDCEVLGAIERPPVSTQRDHGLTFLVPFSKAYWLSDLLEPHDRPEACVFDAWDRLRAKFASDPSWFDANAILEEDPAGLFYKKDHHWNGAGRLAIAEGLVERLAPGIWDDDAVVAVEETLTETNTRFLGIATTATLPAWEVQRDVEFEIVEDQYGLGILALQHSTASGDDVIPGTTYLFGDSQLGYVVPLIEQYFEALVFVAWFRAAVGGLESLPAPDHVVAESIDATATSNFGLPAFLQVTERLPDRPD